jgi:hypothetical protein
LAEFRQKKKKKYFGCHMTDCAVRIAVNDVSAAADSGSGCLCSLFCSQFARRRPLLFLSIGFLRVHCTFFLDVSSSSVVVRREFNGFFINFLKVHLVKCLKLLFGTARFES